MNGAFPEMLHCITSSPEMTVLERQRARLRWHQEQSFFNGAGTESGAVAAASFYLQGGNFLGFGEGMEAAQMTVKPDPSLEIEHHWGGFGCLGFEGSSVFEMNGGISRTASCPPAVAATAAVATMETRGGGDSAVLTEMKVSAQVGKESFKKRKLDSALTKNDEDESHETKDKKIKVCIEDMESKITEQSNNSGNKKDSKNNKKEACGSTSKDNSKASEVQKPDFIHVRARRGQATDSHSLAERVRREKISERMKFLQDLVPGCNKITGKAGMLDEIINYVQSLQRQVEFLSMKLAAVNPRFDFDGDSLFVKEMIPACTATYPTIDMPPEMANPAFLQFNPTQQPVSCSGLEMAINPDMGLRRTTSAPVSSPETFIDSSFFTQLQQPSTWDNDLHSLYNLEFHHGRATSYPSHQQFMGSIEASNLKMEM